MRQALLLLAFIFLLGAAPMRETRTVAGVEATLEIQSSEVSLSGKLTLILSVEGDAPLRTILPKNLLEKEFSPLWRLRTVSEAKTTPLTKNRERFVQEFELTPYLAGEKVPLQLVPFSVRDGTSTTEKKIVFDKRFELRVKTQITDTSLKNLLPNTEIERLPPEIPNESLAWRWLLLLLALLLAILFWPRGRREPELETFSRAWMLQELEQLERSDLPPKAWCVRYLQLLRGFVERHHRVPATRFTVRELIQSLPSLPPALQEFLPQCERICFQSTDADALIPFSRHDPILWTMELINQMNVPEKMGDLD
jgi:hypothetical protein